ncbi:MAG TPA: bifunctional DNA-binding transcriptional regulator/O6-methylguanine-DNA methyltransferase Ada, partial [Candidatus Dormibacteraeota bacterium]|nr:bifunctional DNA-binding transcriptional regulator/O6-methylguanine-DNA methyltransferase Ada [Candidatus Dormibacteraeota bacterium]
MTKRNKSHTENWRRFDRRSLWQAVKSRNRQADGAFVFAVSSTGVYCRPSCPARRPSAANVKFFRLPQAAEREGFRPCRRCKPASIPPRDPKLDAVARVCRLIDSRIVNGSAEAFEGDRLTLSALGTAAGMSPYQLDRAFRGALGITPRQYADTQRMRRLKSQLKKGDDVTTALYDAGFGSSSRLYERAPSQLGMTPAEYGRGGQGMSIRFTIVDSPLGRLLVAATGRGVSALYLSDSDAELTAALRKEYPRADLLPDGGGRTGSIQLQRWVTDILKHLRGREPHLDLPTDVRATAFQRRVWEELRKIPYGATRSYSDVARSIGKPSAVRAVARACAANPVAVVVPCHRVVSQDGKLTGYRWGTERKRELLQKESEV